MTGLLVAACGDDGGTGAGEGAAPTTTTTSVPPTELAAGLCEAAIEPTGGNVANGELIETSGLAYAGEDGRLWAHNDSGDVARVFALDESGADLGTVELEGVDAFDVEDMAVATEPGGVRSILLADIGDNAGRRETVSVLSFPEPDAAPGAGEAVAVPAAEVGQVELRYPDGPRDAETLLYDPRTAELVIVHKRLGGAAEVYAALPDPTRVTDLEKVGVIDFAALEDQPEPPAPGPGVPPLSLVIESATGGDVDPTGSVIALRTYGAVFVWAREDGQTLAEALVDNEPCVAPSLPEEQGEAIAIRPDASGFVTVSEGERPPVNLFTARSSR